MKSPRCGSQTIPRPSGFREKQGTSFFVAFAGLVDSLMVSRMGVYAVALIGRNEEQRKRRESVKQMKEIDCACHATLVF